MVLRPRSQTGSVRLGSLLFVEHLLRQVVLVAHFLDQVKLGFDPIHMALFILDDVFQYFPARIVREFETDPDA